VTDLPQLAGDLFLTDGGMETTLIFRDGLDLPCFAAFTLLETDEGVAALRRYFEPYLAIAERHGAGFVVDTVTWRANPDWGERLGYSPEALDDVNRRAVAFAASICDGFSGRGVVNGVVGPRGDGYVAGEQMTAAEAERYHGRQVATLAEAGAELVSALTLTYADEATGIVRAASAAGIPAVVSFTVETDGRLPSGQALGEAITQVERATDGAAAYYMVNCAHPTHLEPALEDGAPWMERVRGLRANASSKSHAELDAAKELDDGDPDELGAQYRELGGRLTRLSVLGGCCGTDHRHVAAIGDAWLGA